MATFTEFHQREELTTRLHNILEEYPAGVSVFKYVELLAVVAEVVRLLLFASLPTNTYLIYTGNSFKTAKMLVQALLLWCSTHDGMTPTPTVC
jgi:hypothetical protein